MSRLATTAAAAVLVALVVASPPGAGAAAVRAPALARAGVYDQGFTPPKIKIRKRGVVLWTWDKANSDSHTVTLIDAPRGVKAFSSPKADGGYRYKRRFTKAGKYVIFCTLHPGNQQSIIVG